MEGFGVSAKPTEGVGESLGHKCEVERIKEHAGEGERVSGADFGGHGLGHLLRIRFGVLTQSLANEFLA